MKLTYYSQVPNRGLLVVAVGGLPNTFVIRTCIFRNIAGLKALFYQVAQQADINKKTLLYDISRLYPGEADIVRSFLFSTVHEKSTTPNMLIRRPQTDLEMKPFEMQYLFEDNSGTLHPIVNYMKANRYAVINMYGERLNIYETEEAANSLLLRRS